MNTKNIESPFQMLGTKIISFSMKNDFVTIGPDLMNKAKFSVSYVLGESVKNEVDQIQAIQLNIKISASIQDAGKFSVNLVIEGGFKAPLAVDEERFDRFMRVNGSASLYSIARGFITSTTAQAFSGGSVILPLINTMKLEESTEKNK